MAQIQLRIHISISISEKLNLNISKQAQVICLVILVTRTTQRELTETILNKWVKAPLKGAEGWGDNLAGRVLTL